MKYPSTSSLEAENIASETGYCNAVLRLRELLSSSTNLAPRNKMTEHHMKSASSLDCLFSHQPSTNVALQKSVSCANIQSNIRGRGTCRRNRHCSWNRICDRDLGCNSCFRGFQDFRSLVCKQEIYIAQLEKETMFCRQQLECALDAIQDVIPNEPEEHAADENNFRLEFDLLHQKLREANKNTEEANRRENEAVDQVRLSVELAERVRMEKREQEVELNRLRMQLEIQQIQIRTLTEGGEQMINDGQVEELRREYELSASRVKADFEEKLVKLDAQLMEAYQVQRTSDEALKVAQLDLGQAKHECATSNVKFQNKIKSLEVQLQRTEELLEASRRETLQTQEGSDVSGCTTKVHQLEQLLERQRHVIGQLSNRCLAISDRLESAISTFSQCSLELSKSNEELLGIHKADLAKITKLENQVNLSQREIFLATNGSEFYKRHKKEATSTSFPPSAITVGKYPVKTSIL